MLASMPPRHLSKRSEPPRPLRLLPIILFPHVLLAVQSEKPVMVCGFFLDLSQGPIMGPRSLPPLGFRTHHSRTVVLSSAPSSCGQPWTVLPASLRGFPGREPWLLDVLPSSKRPRCILS